MITESSMSFLRKREQLYKSHQLDLACNDIPGHGLPCHHLYAMGWKTCSTREVRLRRLRMFTICFTKLCET
jgi:hypothetical protein